MYAYFAGNYRWSFAVHDSLRCGAQIGEIDRALRDLRTDEPSEDDWAAAWSGAAEAQERLARRDLERGFRISAGERLLKASVFHITAERQLDRGERKAAAFSCLTVDSPGVGEPLRLRNVPSRPDYETPAAAIIDYLETRQDVDSDRIGVMGVSLGGYYAPRAAAFETRIRCCVASGAILDYGATWARRFASPQRMFELVGSDDKEFRRFTEDEDGAEHCQSDEPHAALHYICDWAAEKLDR